MDFKRINVLFAIAAAVFSPTVIEYKTLRDILLFPLIFVGAYILLNVLFWVTVLLISLTANPKKRYKKPSRFYGFVLNSAYFAICRLVGIRINVNGLDKAPKEKYMLVANHRSKFDNMVLAAVLRRPELMFVSKPSNFKIPIARRFMARCCYLPIDRENPKKAIVTVNDCAALVKEKSCCAGVFPEGKRGNGPGVDEFSDGCFLIAKKAECGILVATLKGTEGVHKNFPFRTTDVELDFLSYMPYSEIENRRSGDISASVREIMQSNLTNKGSNHDEICNVQPSCQQ